MTCVLAILISGLTDIWGFGTWKLADELEKISRRSKPFVARLSSLGGFSQVTDPQIIWAGIGEGHEAFEKLEKLFWLFLY